MATIATHSSLLISLADVARLARVQRPVVSMWRSRSAATDSPFPPPIERAGAQERFDAEQVVAWLELTRRGNNPDVRADVAAFTSLTGVSSLGDETVFDGLTALLTLKAITRELLGGLGAEALVDLADDADPDDLLLLREVTALGEDLAPLAAHVDGLSNADFSPAEAFERLMRDRFRHLPGHAVVALRDDARSLVAQVARALAAEADIRPALFVDPTCGGSDLMVATVGLYDHDSAPSVMTSDEDAPAGRLARRRLRVHDIHRQDLHVDDDGVFEFSMPAVLLAQLPSPGSPSMTTVAMLTAIDNIAAQMADDQRAVVIAPAAVLSDRLLDPECGQLRDSVLRLGRVRAVVRLPKGMVTARPREQLTIWVLGPSYDHVPADERWTMLADLANVPLTADVVDDLVTDLVASMGDQAMVRAHAFRFTRMVTTRILLASRRGNLVEVAPRIEPARAGSAADVAVRIATLKNQLQDDIDLEPMNFDVQINPAIDNFSTTEHITVSAALRAGSLRVIAGNRVVAAGLDATNGAPVIGPAELTGELPLGQRQVDRLTFAASYDAGRYTEPGDVVFCTSPRIGAVVDDPGGSVVVAPARVLRVDRHKPHGLLPQVIAADINRVAPQAKQWRLWRLRRAPVEQLAPLRETLKAIDAERVAALDRASQLAELAALVTAGVTDTTLTITTHPREEGR